MTLGITIAHLSLSRQTFDQKELHELSPDNGVSFLGQYHSMICDAATGRIYLVTENKTVQMNTKTAKAPMYPRPAPSKIIYFEYLGRRAPYPHVVRQMADQHVSPEQCQRVTEASHKLQQCKYGDQVSQIPSLTCERVNTIAAFNLASFVERES
jgi:hypothetical protein